MALALVVVRFEFSPQEGKEVVDSGTQQGSVIVADNASGNSSDLGNALEAASSGSGELRDLVIDDVLIGSGEEVIEGSSVTVHYIGSTQNGVQFDSSYARGEPFNFTVGAGKVIEGWEVGLIGMKVGGQRVLVIPADMAYGNRQVGPIPAGSPLVFAVELLDVK